MTAPAHVEVVYVARHRIETRRWPAHCWERLLRRALRLRPGADVMPAVIEINEFPEGAF